MSETRDRFARIFAEEGVAIYARICAEHARALAPERIARLRRETEEAMRRSYTPEFERGIPAHTDDEMRAYSRELIEPVLQRMVRLFGA